MSQTKRAGCLLLIHLVVLSGASVLFSESETPPPDRPLDSLAKSLLVPGWGQLAEKRFVEGFLFLTAEAFCVYQFFHWNRKGNAVYESYKQAVDIEDAVRFRRQTETYDARRNRFLLAGVLVWAANLVDMSIIVRTKQKGEEKITLRIGSTLSENVEFSLSVRF